MPSLYYDGDSFSCDLRVGETKTTGHVIAERLGYELNHYGFHKKNPSKIIRSAMRYSFNKSDALMLIGIGVTARLEIPITEVKPFRYGHNFFHEEHNVIPIHGEDCKPYVNLLEWQYIETCTLFNLITLHDYLLYNNINFLIHNLASNYCSDPDYIFASGVESQIRNRPRIVNFYENSLHSLMKDNDMKPWDYDKYGWMGHPDEKGHAMYADFLMEHIEKYV